MARDMIDRDSATPIWQQLASLIRDRIRDGTYPPGRILPSEVQLEQEHQVARGTIRKAIGQLRDEGLVQTVPGKGTYVADPLPDEDG